MVARSAVDGKKGESLSRSRSLFPVVLLVLLCLVGVAGVAGCGDSGASDEEIAAAEKRGEKKGRFYRMEKEKQRRLEKAIQEIRKGQKNGDSDSAVPPTTGGGSSDPTPPSERTSCGGGLEVGPATTCEFAANVRAEYESEIGSGPGTVYAYSPANDELYEMSCTAAPHECTGAISARVYFP